MIQKITTERISVANSGQGIPDALSMTEKTVGLLILSEKDRLRARLLAEEMFSMIRTIAGEFNAEFWIEQEEDKTCTLHLEAKSQLDYGKRQELISASTSGKNSAHLGLMDKIRGIFEAGMYGIEESFRLQAEYGTGFPYGSIGIPDDGMTDALYCWSMQKYKEDIEAGKDNDPDSWDELEKSIIANLADEVKVGVTKDKIELVVIKKF